MKRDGMYLGNGAYEDGTDAFRSCSVGVKVLCSVFMCLHVEKEERKCLQFVKYASVCMYM